MSDTGYNLNQEQSNRVMQLHSQKETGGLELSPLQVPTQGNFRFMEEPMDYFLLHKTICVFVK